MTFRPRGSTILARLRASTRLAMLVLLVAALKLGAAAACAKQDYADLRLGAGNAQGAVVQAMGPGAGDHSEASLPLAGACSHCGCHQASALPTIPAVALAPAPRERTADYPAGTPPSIYPRLELRPPIA